MKQPVFYTAGTTDALHHARNHLLQWGYELSPSPSGRVTHLLLPVPSFDSPGILKGGQLLDAVLGALPEDVTVLGGNLPQLPCPCVDFLQDEFYLAENAGITAHCTLKLLRQQAAVLAGAKILIIGWGRIGKRLIPLLKSQGASVTAAVRKEKDLQALRQLQCDAVTISHLVPKQYDIIINTAPAPLLHETDTDPSALLIDLASVRGIAGDRVIWARGLPNKDAPDVSGILIAKTALRYALGKE